MGGRYEEPNPLERFLAFVTEGKPTRTLSRDPTRVSGPGCVCFSTSNEIYPEGEVDARPSEVLHDGDSVLDFGNSGCCEARLGDLFLVLVATSVSLHS